MSECLLFFQKWKTKTTKPIVIDSSLPCYVSKRVVEHVEWMAYEFITIEIRKDVFQ
jgi:hypothetical protein